MASPGTPATGPDTEPRPGWWPLAIISSAHLMAVLDTTIMFVALPSIQHALKMTDSSRQWVVTAYTLALAGLLLLGGRLADKLGARRTLIIGVVGFAVASAAGGASVDGAMLIAARAVQGAFGAILTSSTRSLLVTTYRGEQRGQAISLFTATLTAGLGVGLVLGGVITSALGWRWCLYLNLIFSAVVVLGAPRVLAPSPRRADVHIDLLSVVLASVGMVGLVYGLGQAAAAGWSSGSVIGSLAAAVVLLGGVILRQAGHSDRLLPLRVISDRNRGWGMATLIVNGLSTFAMLLILTYQLQAVMHYSALKTGLALVPFAAGAALGSAFIAPRLISRIATRWLLTGAILIEAEGLGPGLAGPVTLNLALRGVLPADSGAAGAATSAAGQLGSSVGAALFNTIAAAAAAGYLRAHPGVGVVAGTVHGFDVAMAWGALVMVAAAIPVALFVHAPAPAPKKG